MADLLVIFQKIAARHFPTYTHHGILHAIVAQANCTVDFQYFFLFILCFFLRSNFSLRPSLFLFSLRFKSLSFFTSFLLAFFVAALAVIVTATRLWAGKPMARGSTPATGKRLLVSQPPVWLWDPPNFLVNVCRGSVCQLKRLEREACHSSRLKISTAINVTRDIPSWHARPQPYLFTFCGLFNNSLSAAE